MVPFTIAGAFVHMALSLANRDDAQRRFERFWFGAVLRLARARVEVRGRERLRPGASYVIMPNHRSWFDIPVLYRGIGDLDFRWVGKREIVPVPFFGWSFGLSRHIVIDRHRREEGIRAIRRAARVSGGGVSIMIFPEGTRSLSRELLPFKKGGFHLAVDTGLEILPIAIEGTERVMRKREWTIRPGTVTLTVCEPMAPPPQGKAALPQVMEAVRERILAALHPPTAKEAS